MKHSVGVIGFGNFGQFIVKFLTPYVEISVYDRTDYSNEAKRLGVIWSNLHDVVKKDIVILGVPVQFLEPLLVEIKDIINPEALVMDVSSVKVKPLQLLEKYLPETTDIIGTHPLFGPQSGKNGIAGLNLVLCPVRNTKISNIAHFFSKKLKLNILERTAEVHDRQMAYVQALTHFIGRTINEMDIPDVEQKTPAYQYLLDIKRNLGKDSMDLFLTIELENPFAKEVREQFLEKLNDLNNMLANY
jgi:prephenate dehydrogenase